MASTTPNMSLVKWDLLTDFFNHTDLANNLTAIDNHDHTAGKGLQVGVGGIANLAIGTSQLQDSAVTGTKISPNTIGSGQLGTSIVGTAQLINAGVTADKLADAARLGLTDSSNVRRGATNIATTESRTNVAYGTLTTPDQVTGIVLPTNGLIAVWYQATWQESVAGGARAAIFIGATQLQVAQGNVNGSRSTQAAATNGATTLNNDRPLLAGPMGLFSQGNNLNAYAGDLTTGQAAGYVAIGAGIDTIAFELNGTTYSTSADTTALPFFAGGPCYIFAAAGTYTVSVQFKASSGSVTAKNRKLWVSTLGF